MISSRRIVRLYEIQDDSLRERLASGVPEQEATALAKDAHLIAAALLTDRIIISRDEEARRLFGIACKRAGELGEILWANPEFEDEQVAAWLQRGARVEKKRKLTRP
jgi:hypothetical protein